MNHLVSCPTCARHVRAHEAACPFCASALPASALPTTEARLSITDAFPRLSRAKLFALGTAAAALATACSGALTPPPEPTPTVAQQPTAEPAQPSATATAQAPPMMPRYGAPPAFDDEEV